MEDKLIEYTDKIVEALESGVEFAGEQAPLLIQEVLTYYTFASIIEIIIFLSLFICSSYFIYYVFKNGKNPDSFFTKRFGNEHRVFPLIFAWAFTLGSFIFTLLNILQLVKILVAPRLFLIEKLAGLL